MIRNDFIMRLIELLGAFLAKVLKKIEDGDLEGAGKDIEKVSKETIGLPMAILENNQPDNLISLFSSPSAPDYSRIMAAAILLDVRGEIVAREGDEISAYLHWTKATTLFLCAANSPDKAIEERCVIGIGELEKKLVNFDIPADLHLKLATHHEQQGNFALAEDHWFEGTRESEESARILSQFYQRLLAFSDLEIERGSLTRLEIEQSVEEL